MTADQLGLFGGPTRLRQQPVKRCAADGTGAIRWAQYTLKTRRQCDYCVRDEHALGNVLAPINIRSAKFRRTQGDTELFLCARHTLDQKETDA